MVWNEQVKIASLGHIHRPPPTLVAHVFPMHCHSSYSPSPRAPQIREELLGPPIFVLKAMFSFRRNFAKFQPQKNDFNLYNKIFMKKFTKICQILKRKKTKLLNVYDKFQ